MLRFDGATGAFRDVFVARESGGYSFPWDLTVGPGGDLFVSDQLGNVRRFSKQGGAPLGLFVTGGTNGETGTAQAIVFGPDGNLYLSDITNFSTSHILRYSGSNGAFISQLAEPPGTTDLAFGPDGLLYLACHQMNEVRRYNVVTGEYLGVFIPSGSGGMTRPFRLDFGPDGNLYVGTLRDGGPLGEVYRFNGVTGAAMGAFVPNGPAGIAGWVFDMKFGPDGNLYVNDAFSGIKRFNGVTGAFIDVFVPAGSGGFDHTHGMVFADVTAACPRVLHLNEVRVTTRTKAGKKGFTVQVSVTNIGAADIPGPLSVIVGSIAPAGTALTGAAGTTACEYNDPENAFAAAGKPYVNVTLPGGASTLRVKKTAKVTLRFTGKRPPPGFALGLAVVAGPGAR